MGCPQRSQKAFPATWFPQLEQNRAWSEAWASGWKPMPGWPGATAGAMPAGRGAAAAGTVGVAWDAVTLPLLASGAW